VGSCLWNMSSERLKPEPRRQQAQQGRARLPRQTDDAVAGGVLLPLSDHLYSTLAAAHVSFLFTHPSILSCLKSQLSGTSFTAAC